MQQVTAFLAGERDYSLIKGSTGPIVYVSEIATASWIAFSHIFVSHTSCSPSRRIYRYPAGFLYAYSALYYLTDEGKDIRRAQYIFAAIYVATMSCVFGIYRRCRSVRCLDRSAKCCYESSRLTLLAHAGSAVCSRSVDAVETIAFYLRAATLQRRDRHAVPLRRHFSFDS